MVNPEIGPLAEARFRDIETRQAAHDLRLVAVERRLAVLDAAVSLARWLGPLLVGLAAVVVGKL